VVVTWLLTTSSDCMFPVNVVMIIRSVGHLTGKTNKNVPKVARRRTN
jgi:hypothetical protein